MSFGEGDLHERCEMYRRQLGGTNAALRRETQKAKDLQDQVDELRFLLRAALNRLELDETGLYDALFKAACEEVLR